MAELNSDTTLVGRPIGPDESREPLSYPCWSHDETQVATPMRLFWWFGSIVNVGQVDLEDQSRLLEVLRNGFLSQKRINIGVNDKSFDAEIGNEAVLEHPHEVC